METIIEVSNIHRVFRSIKKEGGGVKEALRLLYRPVYQAHVALKDINFKIEKGAFIGLIGANGAGKTTLLKILSGLIPPTAGQARVLNYEPFQRKEDFRRKISLVMGQKAQLWWDLPAIDAFDLIRAIYKIPQKTYKERLGFLTKLLAVERLLNTQIRRLSLGERMKMELIGAILHWPSVIFLDEPTIGLDVLAAHNLREFLKTFNEKEETTIILTSHNMDDIERLCNRVLILREGSMIYDGKPSGLIQGEQSRLRVRIQGQPNAEEVSKHLSFATADVQYDEDDQAYLINLKKDQIVSTFQRLLGKFNILDMRVEDQTLESVIQRLYESSR